MLVCVKVSSQRICSPKGLELITPEMRQDYFNSMLEKIVSDPVYKIGVEAPLFGN